MKTFLGDYKTWNFFLDKSSGEKIYYRTAIVTLKTTGRVTVYAFHGELLSRTKFIIISAKRKRPPSSITVYTHYRFRWRIEEAHRDLKQQFGLSKCQVRQEWTVSDFVGLVFFGYSFWKFTQFLTKKYRWYSFKMSFLVYFFS